MAWRPRRVPEPPTRAGADAPRTRGPILSGLGLISLIFWVLVIALRVFAVSGLPSWHAGLPEGGCYFSDRLIVYIGCNGTMADALFANTLTWTYYFTTGIFWLATFFPPVLVPWSLSIVFLVNFLISKPATAGPPSDL